MRTNKTHILYCLCALSVLILSVLLIKSKSTQEWFANHFSIHNKQKVLSSLDLNFESVNYTFVKSYSAKSLNITVYKGFKKQDVLQSFQLHKVYDAQMKLKGQSTSLAAKDIDSDGEKEILVPYLDEDRVPKLYILRFNALRAQFEVISSQSLLPKII